MFVAVPVVLLLLILAALIAVIWYRRYVCYLIAFYYPVRADCEGYAMESLDVFPRFKVHLLLLKYSTGGLLTSLVTGYLEVIFLLSQWLNECIHRISDRKAR